MNSSSYAHSASPLRPLFSHPQAHFPEWRLDSFPGFLGNVTAGRCSNVFNLDGMNCVVDAACASSLVAVKVAIDELLHGHCRTMVAGATCTDCSIGMYMAFSKTPVFSHKQSVTAYDKVLLLAPVEPNAHRPAVSLHSTEICLRRAPMACLLARAQSCSCSRNSRTPSQMATRCTP